MERKRSEKYRKYRDLTEIWDPLITCVECARVCLHVWANLWAVIDECGYLNLGGHSEWTGPTQMDCIIPEKLATLTMTATNTETTWIQSRETPRPHHLTHTHTHTHTQPEIKTTLIPQRKCHCYYCLVPKNSSRRSSYHVIVIFFNDKQKYIVCTVPCWMAADKYNNARNKTPQKLFPIPLYVELPIRVHTTAECSRSVLGLVNIYADSQTGQETNS